MKGQNGLGFVFWRNGCTDFEVFGIREPTNFLWVIIAYVQFPQDPGVPAPAFFCCRKVLTSSGKNPNLAQGAHKLCARSVPSVFCQTIPILIQYLPSNWPSNGINPPMGPALSREHASHWIIPLTGSSHSRDQPSYGISPLTISTFSRDQPSNGINPLHNLGTTHAYCQYIKIPVGSTGF